MTTNYFGSFFVITPLTHAFSSSSFSSLRTSIAAFLASQWPFLSAFSYWLQFAILGLSLITGVMGACAQANAEKPANATPKRNDG